MKLELRKTEVQWTLEMLNLHKANWCFHIWPLIDTMPPRKSWLFFVLFCFVFLMVNSALVEGSHSITNYILWFMILTRWLQDYTESCIGMQESCIGMQEGSQSYLASILKQCLFWFVYFCLFFCVFFFTDEMR